MTFCLVNRKRVRTWFRLSGVAIVTLGIVITSDHVGAASRHSERPITSVDSREPGEPILAIVSLRSQRITVYDAKGWIHKAPVSSGQKGRETPAGVFSVIEKQAEHYSNLYDDAFMPHMQRITWSGVALHGGPLPGYAASHGCIRMPYDFAERLFDETKLGLRVVVAPRDVVPVEIAHPALFKPKPGSSAVAAARTAEATEATRKADEAKRASVTAFRDAAQATIPVRRLENLKLIADTQLAAAERSAASAVSADAKERAEDVKAKVTAKVAELADQLSAAKTEAQPKLDAAAAAREAAAAAETTRVAAAQAAQEARRALEPVSVFISRKTQRLYVRQAFQPILESPVTIADPDRPIGTHIFTAMERGDSDADLRWSVVSLENGRPDGALEQVSLHGRDAADAEPKPSDAGGAKEALDRITIPQDIADRIASMTSPRSSLIISDEPLSSETSKGTDFVVIMSDEPQGGIKFRRHSAPAEVRYERPSGGIPFWSSRFGRNSTW
jgi:hypothetical protein